MAVAGTAKPPKRRKRGRCPLKVERLVGKLSQMHVKRKQDKLTLKKRYRPGGTHPEL